ncbi:MAG TPA: hypothetical protein VK424_04640 [Thermoplasmata archaeon]|nr:hypothetical protein [Thermoplasmata archaeon]
MSEYGDAHHAGTKAHVRSPINVGWVVLAALLIGSGLFLIAYWLYMFDLRYSFGIALVVIGGLMLFHPRAGLDHA